MRKPHWRDTGLKPSALKTRLLEIYYENRPALKSKAGAMPRYNPAEIAFWRQKNKASIAKTAKQFGVSAETVSVACRIYGAAVMAERQRWRFDLLVKAAEAAGRADAYDALAQRMRAAGLRKK